MLYVVYFDKDTGKVRQQSVAPDLLNLTPPSEGCQAAFVQAPVRLPGFMDGGTYFHTGSPPTAESVFNYVTKQWEDPRQLEDFKLEKLRLVKAARNTQEFAPFTYNGMTLDGDLDAQRRLSVLVSAAKSAIAAGYSFAKDFTLADNTVVQLTAEDFIGIEMAKLWQVDAAFQEYRVKKVAIEAATTLEELEAV